MQDHPDAGPPAKARSGCAVVVAIVASSLVAIPIVFMVRGLATECQVPHALPSWWLRKHALPSWWVRQPCPVDVNGVLATIKLSLLDIGVALLGGGVGWIAAARQHRQRRWPAAATGALITMSTLYAIYFFLALNALGRWSF